MQFNDFIGTYIDKQTAAGRDFASPRGWIALANIVLRDLETRGFFSLNQVKEIGVVPNNGLWITLPSDFRTLHKLFIPQRISAWRADPNIENESFGYNFVNGMIRLDHSLLKDNKPTYVSLENWTVNGVNILTTSATADQYKDSLLVLPSIYGLNNQYISGNTAAAGGFSTLSFLFPIATAPTLVVEPVDPGQYGNFEAMVNGESLANNSYFSTMYGNDLLNNSLASFKGASLVVGDVFQVTQLSTTPLYIGVASIVQRILMMRYLARFTVLSTYTDLIPVLDPFLNVLVAGLYVESCSKTDQKYQVYLADYQNALSVAGLTEFTPSEDQARPEPRPMPGYQILPEHWNMPNPERYL
jgi:hypothetical protein